MDDQVTVRAIAYTAVMVCYSLSQLSRLIDRVVKLHFALTDATHWMSDYNGFNYEEFYEFIIDFFEVDKTAEGRAAATELINWWNMYVSNSTSGSEAGADGASPGKYSRGPPRRERSHLHRCGYRRSKNCKRSAAEIAYPTYLPSPV